MNLFQMDSNVFSTIIVYFCHVYHFLPIFKINRLILISTIGKSTKNITFYMAPLNIPEDSHVPELNKDLFIIKQIKNPLRQ